VCPGEGEQALKNAHGACDDRKKKGGRACCMTQDPSQIGGIENWGDVSDQRMTSALKRPTGNDGGRAS